MTRPQWSLAGLLSAVLFVALAAAGYRILWSADHPNARVWLAMFLALVTTATLGAWRGHPAVRRQCLGYAAFGWTHLLVVLILFGWPVADIYDAERMTSSVQAGMIIARWPRSSLPGCSRDLSLEDNELIRAIRGFTAQTY